MKRKAIHVKNRIFQVFCIILGVVLNFPIVYAVLISFMRPEEILTKTVHLLPCQIYLENYMVVWKQTPILRFLLNSFIVAFVSSLIRIFTAGMAGFSFAFFEYKGKRILFYLVVASMIIPPDVLLIQNYFTTAQMGLINTYLGMMLPFFVSSMNIFVMRGHFLSYSKSLYDAARIDGSSSFRFFSSVLMPSSVSVISTVFISSFVGTWNTYLWPLLVTNVNEMRTAQVAITMLNANEGSSYGYGVVMAAAVIILIPSVFVFLVFQKRIVGGMMTGAVKG